MRNPHEAVGQACDIRDSGVRVLPPGATPGRAVRRRSRTCHPAPSRRRRGTRPRPV